MKLWANNKIRIVLTGECNINCFYCHNEGQPKSVKYLSENLFNHFVEIIKDENELLDGIKFTGGEPLLHPQLEKFIYSVAELSKGKSIVTNGLLLTEDKLKKLQDAGLTKIRLGVDSIFGKKSRPSNLFEKQKPIIEIIDLLMKSNFPFELNTVLTRFNRKEIPSIIRFCQDRSISAKLIEMIKVDNFGDESHPANMNSLAQVPFSEIEAIATSNIKGCRHYSDQEMKGANYIFAGDHFEIRYCRHLCDYNMCYKTGTRIDPDGIVHACMSQRGKFKISYQEPISKSREIIFEAINSGCLRKIST